MYGGTTYERRDEDKEMSRVWRPEAHHEEERVVEQRHGGAEARAISTAPLGRSIAAQGRLMGLGDVEVISMRNRGDDGDYVKIGVRDPFFLPAFSGMVAGSMEALIGRECGVSYEEVSPGCYEVISSVSNEVLPVRSR